MPEADENNGSFDPMKVHGTSFVIINIVQKNVLNKIPYNALR